MKVLFVTRSDIFKNVAGDTRLICNLRKALLNFGVEAHWSWQADRDLRTYDLFHFFNISRPEKLLNYFHAAKKLGVKIALTPIFWAQDSWEKYLSAGAYYYWRNQNHLRQAILNGVDIIMPSGQAEADCLVKEYGDLPRMATVYCGTSFQPSPRPWKPGLVLCAARISPRKNQHLLAKVCRELNLPLVLAGANNDTNYLLKLKKTYPDVMYVGNLSDNELIKAYQMANVHALPSWFETPGLSSLEAAACGSNIVSTTVGTAREYFGDKVQYCQPGDIADLRNAVQRAVSMPRNKDLSNTIWDKFTWTQSAKQTISGYLDIIGE